MVTMIVDLRNFLLSSMEVKNRAQAAADKYKGKIDNDAGLKLILKGSSKKTPLSEVQPNYFAVAGGKAVGIFFTEEFRDAQLKDCSFQKHMSFPTIEEAAEFIENNIKGESSTLNKNFPVESKRVPSFSSLRTATYLLDFYVDGDGFVQVFTDGSCFDNGKKGAKAGAGVYFGPGHQMNISIAVTTQKQSNNVAELQAVQGAINVAKICGIKKLMIHSDSKYVIRIFMYWVNDWESNGWILKGAYKPVENKELISEIINMIRSLDITVNWNHVPAHRGIIGNEGADKLAKAGARGVVVNWSTRVNAENATNRKKGRANHRHHPYLD